MLKNVQAVEANTATNVVLFPVRPTTVPGKAARRGRKAKYSNVLKFTGKKIRNYDPKAEQAAWKKSMTDLLISTMERVSKGEATGLMIGVAMGDPRDDGDPRCIASLSGSFSADFGFASRHARWVLEWAEEMEEKSPARPV